MRHLTTLLPTSPHSPPPQLAPWVTDLAGEAEAQSRDADRAGACARQLALRADALATADGILSAPTSARAAARLAPWTELTPTTNDGPLGWLADRTVLTPTLTRLVAGRPPRTGACPTTSTTILEGVYPSSLTLVPGSSRTPNASQAPRRRLYLGRDTVRLFASPSLARMPRT